MRTNAELAASVAKALNLWASGKKEWYDDETGGYSLGMDGRAVFDEYWQVRCRNWLLELGWNVSFHHDDDHEIWKRKGGSRYELEIDCPAYELCARAIDKIINK